MKKSEIPKKPQVFSRAITSIFGEGAEVIEELIMQRIKRSFELEPRSEPTLTEAILALKAEQ